MECDAQWVTDILNQINLVVLSITLEFKNKPTESLTLLIAFFALWTWKSTINAEADIRLRESILDTITDWEVAVVDACVASQPNKRKTDEPKAIEDASAIINRMSVRLQKVKTLVEHTTIGNQQQASKLAGKLQEAIELNTRMLEIIKTRWYADQTAENAPEVSKQVIENAINPNKSASDLISMRLNEVPQAIKSIARATDFLRPTSCFQRLKNKVKGN